MKIPREATVERAIMITMSARDMEACVESFDLYSSATRVLEKNSETYCVPGYTRSEKNKLGRYITDGLCFAASTKSSFSELEIRGAIAEALRLARKELSYERSNKNSRKV